MPTAILARLPCAALHAGRVDRDRPGPSIGLEGGHELIAAAVPAVAVLIGRLEPLVLPESNSTSVPSASARFVGTRSIPGDREYESLKRAIQEFGMIDPVVFNARTKRLVGGHQRLTVLRDLGHTTCPPSWSSSFSPARGAAWRAGRP